MPKFRKKPIEIEANQYQGRNDIAGVCRRVDCMAHGMKSAHVHTIHDNQAVEIVRGDWIIPEPDGVHFYPCKDEIFRATYDPVIERDICKGGCGMDFAEFPEMRHSEEECGGMECTCYEIIGGHQMGCPYYGAK